MCDCSWGKTCDYHKMCNEERVRSSPELRRRIAEKMKAADRTEGVEK